ncbi:unnamed protein product [Microthlaspi erraticum]|uniref:Retrotransposon gag domain-containing protein n=1 Tax=Microthlaspi erraticum TaxID=1685480 RepID=A0A6D2HYD9_9BRAS|nr:unnamed protein product [Microthlaspi erraticum]
MFHGLPSEDPIDHLDEFDRLCDLTKINGVSEDAIKLRLFPMSLADKAHQWEKSLPHGTITTWDECKKAFLAKFFSTGRTAKLRGVRYPASSGTMRHSLRLGRGSRLHKYREMLTQPAMGTSSTRMWMMAGSLWKHSKLQWKLWRRLDKLILAQSTMKKVNFVSAEEMEPVQEGEDTQFAEVCYMSNGQGGPGLSSTTASSIESSPTTWVWSKEQLPRPQGTFPGQQMHIPPGFPHQPPQPAPTPENELKAMLKQLLQGQADGVVDTSKKLAEINSKIENLNTRVYSLENHASSVAAATKQGQLPGKAIQNPKEQCKAPGVQIDQPEVQHLLWPFTLHQLSSHNKLDRQLDRVRHHLSSKPILLDPYQPVDISSSPTQSRHKEVIHKFRRDPSGIGIELPSMESMSEAFDQMKMVKDQGKFTLPCTLGHLELDNALVDSGASINLISLTMAEKLGIAGALQRPTTSIMFGDATSKSPLGVFKNYHLKIGECIIQTDLTVMEMEEEKDLPLLLGTPFLSTVGASIDFHKQEVILHKVNSLVSYRLQPRESLQALFDEPLGRALKEGEDVASKARPGDKRKSTSSGPFIKPSQLTMTLFPTKFENGKIEYKIRYKGRSRPFSRAKALVTSEQSRDPSKLKELLSQVLTITLDGGTSSTNA